MPERSKWQYSRARNRIFEICAWFTLVQAALLIFGFVVSSGFPITFENPTWSIRVAFGLLLALIGICMISQFVLWPGMIVWSAAGSEEWVVLRIVLVVAQLVTLNFGSLLVYLFLYRPRHERVHRRVAAQAGVSA